MDSPQAPARPATFLTATACNIDDFAAMVQGFFMPLQLSSAASDFAGRIRSAGRDGVFCYEIAASAHVVERTPPLIARSAGGDYYKFSVMLGGSCLVMQDRREAVLGEGDAALYDTTRPYTLVADEALRMAVVMVPRHLIDLPAGVVGQLTAVRLAGGTGLTTIVAPFLSGLATDPRQLDSPAGGRLAGNAVDLLTTMLVAELDVAADDTSRTVLLRRVCAYIDEHLSDPDLGPAGIAAAHFISVRYLQNLFQAEGTTASAWVRERRLEHSRRDLTDPVLRGRPIAVIAARWGFVEPTHFSRVFKERYGCSPREARALGIRAA